MALSLADQNISLSPTLNYWRNYTSQFTKQLYLAPELEIKREKIKVSLEEKVEDYLYKAPPMVGWEYLNKELLKQIWLQLQTSYHQGVSSYKGSVEGFLKSLTPDNHVIDRIHFHLVENKKNEDRPFAFLATYSTIQEGGSQTKHLPLKYALEQYEADQPLMLELLATVRKASKESKLLKEMLESGELFHPIAFTPKEAYQFLSEVTLYEKVGILCRIPRWWARASKQISLEFSIGNNKPSNLGFDALLDFKASLFFDGDPISEKEAKSLLNASEGLVLIKGKWMAVDPNSLKSSLELLKKARNMAKTEGFLLADAMKILMGIKDLESPDGSFKSSAINAGDWLQSLFKKMRNPDLVRSISLGSEFKATLRPYQQKGLNWLVFLHSLGFGSCLADDMGLGKTIQVLALLQYLKKKKAAKNPSSLLVVPASLLTNWQNEIEKFTPDIKAVIAHPQSLASKELKGLPTQLKKWDLVITTYGMMERLAWVGENSWFYVILDEAQAIKNPNTKQTKAVKKLKNKHRLVLTGTPIENQLSDLWSLFDFLNPGLLGSFGEFNRFTKKLEENPDGYGRLRNVINPYILRRLKTDKTVLTDLPDKVEMKTYAPLSKKQIVIYGQMVSDLEIQLNDVDGIKRRGLILGYLIKFKQLCNHPDQYDGSNEYDLKHSGKFQRLKEICETIYQKREKVLIFTQFKEIIPGLDKFLNQIFSKKGLVLHGGTSVKQRKSHVEQFQSNDYVPYFILSLKAGGVGLNLTAANHVIHFDRWWNPAVENQATDRAFRIGQKKNVMVHKLICKGTVEEKIDQLIEGKTSLVNEVIKSNSENWITEMKDDQLLNMFSLNLKN